MVPIWHNMKPLGRNWMIGLGVGATAGVGLITFIIYKEISRKRSQTLLLHTNPPEYLIDSPDGTPLQIESLEQGRW